MYFLYGNEAFLIQKKLVEIIKNNKDYSIIELNNSTKLNDVLNEITTYSIFDQKKIVIIKNLYLFNKNNSDENNKLIDSFKYIPDETIVVFVYEKDIEKQKNSLINFLQLNAMTFGFKQLNEKELFLFVKEEIENLGGIINDVNLYYFLTKVPNKLSIINNEINKLISFDKNVTKANIDDLVPKYELSRAFEFINAFNDQNIEEIFKIYYEKMEQGELITNLVSQISNVLDLCLKIHSYKEMNYSNEQIANELQKHIFVIKKNNDLLMQVGYSKISRYIDELAKLDIDIKLGNVEEKIGFENFLLNVAKY